MAKFKTTPKPTTPTRDRETPPTDAKGKAIIGTPIDLSAHVMSPWYNVLHCALTMGRPDGSQGITKLRTDIMSYAPQHARVEIDFIGNLWIDTRTAPDEQRTGFMAHLDTVARTCRPQSLLNSGGLMWTPDGDVLGADDGAGCAVLTHLMTSGIPALYLFTQGEERGGIGADYILAQPKWLDRIKTLNRIASFDRRGTTSICGAQGCGNCASPAYVTALANALGMGHEWDTGTYTDNSEFRGIVPEIVNISVGYGREHGPDEHLNVGYVYALAEKCASLDWEGFPVVGPDPDPDPWAGLPSNWYAGGTGGYSDSGYSDSRYNRDVYDAEQAAEPLARSLFIAEGSPEWDLLVDALLCAYERGFDDGMV